MQTTITLNVPALQLDKLVLSIDYDYYPDDLPFSIQPYIDLNSVTIDSYEVNKIKVFKINTKAQTKLLTYLDDRTVKQQVIKQHQQTYGV